MQGTNQSQSTHIYGSNKFRQILQISPEGKLDSDNPIEIKFEKTLDYKIYQGGESLMENHKLRTIALIFLLIIALAATLFTWQKTSENSLYSKSLVEPTLEHKNLKNQLLSRILTETSQAKVQQSPETNMNEEDSQRYMQYSKQNQRKADRARRERRIKKELQQNNILKDIKKNPYLEDDYSYITKDDLERVKKWRFIVGQDPTRPSTLANEERDYYIQKYHIDKYEQLPFCIIVPTFNNKPRKRAERNIRSILMQEYKNFHFIIIDDGSVDGTGALIQNYLDTQTIVDPSRYKVEIHTERGYSLNNIRRAARQFCKPQEILIVVDGDDELLGKQVLKLFNAIFQEKGVWFMYTNFLGSIGKVGYSRPYHPDIIQKNQYRDYSFAVSHLRAYYTQLLLNIKDEDLQDENGNFFTSAGDMAITIPCLQMAHKRVAYVPQMTYYYNFNTGLNVHRKRLNEQRANNLKIRAKPKYEPLEKLF